MTAQSLQMRPRVPACFASQRVPQRRAGRSCTQFVVRAAKVSDGPKIAIVGVTGAVGQEFLRVRRSPCCSVCLCAPDGCPLFHQLIVGGMESSCNFYNYIQWVFGSR